MTGYTVHSGSTESFTQGWDRVFSEPSKQGKNKKAAKKNRSSAGAKGKKIKVKKKS